jgi:hypothetical protein
VAGSKTDLLENEVLRLMTGQSLATLSFPVTPYLALFTVVPTDAAGGTEVTGSSYARQSAAGKFGSPSGGSLTLSTAVDFPTVTSSSYTVVGVACFDAVSSGNMLWWYDVSSTTINVGSFARIPASTGITITEA